MHLQQVAGLPMCSVLADLLPRTAGVTASRLLSASGVFRSALRARHEQSLAEQVACHHQADAPVLSRSLPDPLGNFGGEQHNTACGDESRTPMPAAQQASVSGYTSIVASQQMTGTSISPRLTEQSMRDAKRARSAIADRLYDPGMGSRLSRQQRRCKGTLVKPGSRNSTIAVGVSGGVDSAVAAMLLKDQGCVLTCPLIQL